MWWIVVGLVACNGDKDGGDDTSQPVAPTWYQDVQPFVGTHCQGCHHSQDNFTFALEAYATVSALAPSMLAKMQGSDTPPYFMPPFGVRETGECASPGPWKDDNRPSQEDLDMFTAWIDGGTPEGDEATASPFEPGRPENLEGNGIETYTSVGTTLPEGETEDSYLCFPLDPQRTTEGWITGVQVHPDNTDVVHHVVLFTDPSAASPQMVDATGSYPCFGGSGVSDADVLYAWAPGGQPLSFSDDMGAPLPAGGQLIMQVHYHPTGSEAQDASSVSVRWREDAPGKTAALFVFGGLLDSQESSSHWEDPPFLVPAGASSHQETWREDIDVPDGVDVRLWSLFPHMHLAGTDIKIWVERADGTETCLGHLPAWDFEWQRSYLLDGAFETLPKLLPGDRLAIRCTFDNTTENPMLQEYLGGAAPEDIGVGEDTFDEMCAAILGAVY